VLKRVRAKPPRNRRASDGLHVHVIERGNTFIGTGLANHFGRRRIRNERRGSPAHARRQARRKVCQVIRARVFTRFRQTCVCKARTGAVLGEQSVVSAPRMKGFLSAICAERPSHTRSHSRAGLIGHSQGTDRESMKGPCRIVAARQSRHRRYISGILRRLREVSARRRFHALHGKFWGIRMGRRLESWFSLRRPLLGRRTRHSQLASLGQLLVLILR
jgi:hypothetical protein